MGKNAFAKTGQIYDDLPLELYNGKKQVLSFEGILDTAFSGFIALPNKYKMALEKISTKKLANRQMKTANVPTYDYIYVIEAKIIFGAFEKEHKFLINCANESSKCADILIGREFIELFNVLIEGKEIILGKKVKK